MNTLNRMLAFAGFAALATLVSTAGLRAAPKATPTPAVTASPAPLPTATPEPPSSAIPRLEAKVKADPNDRDSLTQLAGYYLAGGQARQGARRYRALDRHW